MNKQLDALGKRASAAWQELKKGRTWSKWLEVGEALVVFRKAAMCEAGFPAGSNEQPAGAAYNAAMGRYLKQYRLDEIDRSDRTKLIKVMENREAIEKFYATLPLNIRLSLNHPTAVLRRFERETKIPARDTGKLTPHQKTQAELAKALERVTVLEKENVQLKAHIEELEMARESERIRERMDEFASRSVPPKRKPKVRPQAELTPAL
jgi:hypothetical protein